MRFAVALLLALVFYGLDAAYRGAESSSENGAVVSAQTACGPGSAPRTYVDAFTPDFLTVTVVAFKPIRRVRFGKAQHARIDIFDGPRDSPGSFDLIVEPPRPYLNFVVRRAGSSMYVPFTVVDDC